MNEPIPPQWRIFIEYYPLFRRIERTLVDRPWFTDGWLTYIGNQEGLIFLHLFKAGWHNARQKGIHIETWVSADGLRSSTAPVVLHVERDLPRRAEFNRLFIERAGAIMEDWPGYHVAHTNVMERCIHRVPFTKRMLVRQLAAELERLSTLGPIIDRTLVDLFGHTR